jgi:dTDP-4-amino-4,6-dideoxygalactose transaminase
MINVTQTFLPEWAEYEAILKRAWDKKWITNHGELVLELESKLKDLLGVDNFLFCSNGTVAIQMALKALEITGEVITTPFSYVATVNSILWEGCKPVFADIHPTSLCIDPDQIEGLITRDTQAILATHVYGIPCDVERISDIARRHNLKVIYDGAHAFGSSLKGKSLLSFGDITTCSFHATKVFHTIEGGCVVTADQKLNDKLKLYRSFGHIGDEYFSVGINAKNSEFNAAMGLALLPRLDFIFNGRKRVSEYYDRALSGMLVRPSIPKHDFKYNYAYYPVIFESEGKLTVVKAALEDNGIGTRRYFSPSLNDLLHVKAYHRSCPVSEDISSRVLCLPMYPTLPDEELLKITSTIRKALS